MAMNTSNFGYPPSGYSSPYSSPYSSTPTGIRTQRPRFGFSGPTLYPRPRSSASKPNPDSFSDSMINNYGTSTSRIDTSFNSENGYSFNNSYNTSSSNYYSANESFSREQSYNGSSMIHNDLGLRGNSGLMRDKVMPYEDPNLMRGYPGARSFPRGDMQNSGVLSKPASQFGAPKFNYNSAFGNNAGEFKGKFQKNAAFGNTNTKPPFTRKFGRAKRMATKLQTAWRCDLCSLDFTSQIPYDMHLNGAKHAKKIKAKEALSAVQSQTNNLAVRTANDEKSLFCELCNVQANSSLQLQTHLDGNKHKSKLQPKEPKDQSQENNSKQNTTETSVNGKTNGSLVRTLPADFGEPQPSKLAKFACDVCCVAVNSEIQLQQHMTSKKHQNKVDGKPPIKRKPKMHANKTPTTAETPTETEVSTTDEAMEIVSNEVSTKVVGVKTLASSFVQGETLH